MATHRTSRRTQRGFTLIELMVVVGLIAILAALAIPAMLDTNRDTRAFATAQRMAELIQLGRARAISTGAAHAVVLSTDSTSALNVPGKVIVQRAERTINGARVPVNTCRMAGAFGASVNANAPATTVTAPFTSPIVDMYLLGADRRVFESGVQAEGLNDGTAARTELWVCFTPTGRAYVATQASLLPSSQPLLTPVYIDVVRRNAGTLQGLTRRVILSPGGTPRIRSF